MPLSGGKTNLLDFPESPPTLHVAGNAGMAGQPDTEADAGDQLRLKDIHAALAAA